MSTTEKITKEIEMAMASPPKEKIIVEKEVISLPLEKKVVIEEKKVISLPLEKKGVVEEKYIVLPKRGYSYYFGFILLIVGLVMLGGFIAGAVLTSSSTKVACIILSVVGGVLVLCSAYLIYKGRKIMKN